MAKEIYIEFHYNYHDHEKAMQSSFLLFHLLWERVGFTSFPIDAESEMPSPEILIRNPENKEISVYYFFNLQDSKGISNFKRDCKRIKDASLEKRV